MEIRRCQRDVSQRRDLELKLVGRVFRDRFASDVLGVGVWVDSSHFLVGVCAEQRAVVASGAPGGNELGETLEFGGAEGFIVAFQEVVEPILRDEGALEGSDGLGHVVVVEGCFIAGECLRETFRVLGDGTELFDDFSFGWHRHLNGIKHRTFRLSGEVSGASVPELGEVESCVQRCGGVTAAALPERSWRGGFVVDPAFCAFDNVARVAGLRVVC